MVVVIRGEKKPISVHKKSYMASKNSTTQTTLNTSSLDETIEIQE